MSDFVVFRTTGTAITDIEEGIPIDKGINRFIWEIVQNISPGLPRQVKLETGCMIAYIVDKSVRLYDKIVTPYGVKRGYHLTSDGLGSYATIYKHRKDCSHTSYTGIVDTTQEDGQFVQTMKSDLSWKIEIKRGIAPIDLMIADVVILDPRADVDRIEAMFGSGELGESGMSASQFLGSLFKRKK